MSGPTPRFPHYAVAAASSLALIGSSAFAGGRPSETERNWFPEFSGGWAFAQSDTGDVLDDDFTLSGGALFWPRDWPAGIELKLTYAAFDITDESIDAINAAIAQDPSNSGRIDDGDLDTWQFTINGVWGPGSNENGFYLTGGVGAYFLDAELTNTQLVYYPPFCDPWYWWWCVPGGFGPGSVVQASDSSTEFGLNFGIGYHLEAGDGQFFVEAKYHRIETDARDLEFVPINFGFRW